MTSFPGKIIGLFLAFVLLVISPLAMVTLATDLEMKRGVMNETVNLLDKVSSTGTLSELEIGDFYLACSSYGTITDVTITRKMKVVNPDGSGKGTYSSYILVDNINDWNKDDIISVHLEAIDYTGAQKLVGTLLKTFTDKFEFTLSRSIRL